MNKIKLGYACINPLLPDTKMRRCLLKNADDKRLRELIHINLLSVLKILEYNLAKNIYLFRISSDVIPFASHYKNKIKWRKEFKAEFGSIKQFIKKNNMRVSMHPGQYTVLNTENPKVLENAVNDIIYHTEFLDEITDGYEHRIILHIGGVYGDKKNSKKRFIENFNKLPINSRKRLTIENDEKNYNIDEVLEIAEEIDAAVVFDVLHHRINCRDSAADIYDIIKQAHKTWRKEYGVQKIHYSQLSLTKSGSAHSETINIAEFMDFIKPLLNQRIDVMLEVKDKNISVEKIMNEYKNIF